MKKINEKKIFFLDMDGTIYHESKLIDGAKEFFEILVKRNIDYIFLTNNSSKNNDTYLSKLKGFNIPCSMENIYTSVDATIDYLKKYDNPVVYLVGTNDFYLALSKYYNVKTGSYYNHVDVVVIGFDTELTYEKLRCAAWHLENGVDYVAANPDLRCPIEDGRYIPDCGTLMYMFEATTGRKPFVIGKPRSYMIDVILEKYGYSKDDAVVIGDRLYTDIMVGINAGVDQICVLSGEATIDDLNNWEYEPTYVVDSIKDVANMLKE